MHIGGKTGYGNEAMLSIRGGYNMSKKLEGVPSRRPAGPEGGPTKP